MPSQNEVSMLRDDITQEVNSTAEILGTQLFAGNAQSREPDIAHVNQEQLEEAYRQKFLAQDREWLQAEAQRDPQQFMKVAQKIGVVHPDNFPDHTPPPTPEQQAMQQVAPPAVPPPLPPQQVQAMLPPVMPSPTAAPAPQMPPPMPAPMAPPQPTPMLPPPNMLPPQV